MKEVRQAQAAFRADTEILVWEASDSDDLIDTVQRWAVSGRAQVLYIGAHGNSEGLKPSPRSKSLLSWNRLASALDKSKTPIWVGLGACDSSSAAKAWARQSKSFPVSVLFSFKTTRTNESEIYDFLIELLDRTGIYGPGSEANRLSHDISWLEEDVAPLKELSERLRVYKKASGKNRFHELDI